MLALNLYLLTDDCIIYTRYSGLNYSNKPKQRRNYPQRLYFLNLPKMKTADTPIEVYNQEPDLRPTLIRLWILARREYGKIFLPTQKCLIKRDLGKTSTTEIKQYPFHHQKMEFLLIATGGDYVRIIENWNELDNSFYCGRDRNILVSLCEKGYIQV